MTTFTLYNSWYVRWLISVRISAFTSLTYLQYEHNHMNHMKNSNIHLPPELIYSMNIITWNIWRILIFKYLQNKNEIEFKFEWFCAKKRCQIDQLLDLAELLNLSYRTEIIPDFQKNRIPDLEFFWPKTTQRLRWS